MAIHYKFLSTKDYSSIPLDSAVISVSDLKRKIFEFTYKSKKKADSNGLCLGTDFDFVIVNAQTNEQYIDDSLLIPNNTSVLIRRVPGTRRHKPIDTTTISIVQKQQPNSAASQISGNSGSSITCSASTIIDSYNTSQISGNSGSSGTCSASARFDSYRTTSVITGIGSYRNGSIGSYRNGSIGSYKNVFVSTRTNSGPHSSSHLSVGDSASTVTGSSSSFDYDDGFGNDFCVIPGLESVQSSNLGDDVEDRRIKSLINTPALPGWVFESEVGVGGGRRGVENMVFHGFDGRFRFEKKTPPVGYICHRCRVPGHFIQHCPTNGDPDYDFKRMRPPTGIPKSMLMENSAVMQANEDHFDKEIACPTSKRLRFGSDVPQELLCPLCKQVMRDAVLTSKCCFKSFCDKCIRDHLILSKLKCVCGAPEILTDYLIPNITVRDTINRFLESDSGNNSSHGSAKSNSVQVENMESTYCSSTMLSAKSSEQEQKPSLANVEAMANKRKLFDSPQRLAKKAKCSEAANESEMSKRSVQAAEEEEEVQQKVVSAGEIGRRNKMLRLEAI